ncbi:MAG: hypothetical protein OQK73_02645 [Gammaproteobacteria bacterium]|nr:hypothetical protein [Gammaproteobacteria bacterium]
MNNKPDIQHHMQLFAESFILDSRKEKWAMLLSERPETIFNQSSRLFNYLDHNFIEQNDSLKNVVEDDGMGVFYDFQNEPTLISFKEAIDAGKELDAIFSIQPGKLAIYFFHEGWNFVCKR